jgi:hypothetical protein
MSRTESEYVLNGNFIKDGRILRPHSRTQLKKLYPVHLNVCYRVQCWSVRSKSEFKVTIVTKLSILLVDSMWYNNLNEK